MSYSNIIKQTSKTINEYLNKYLKLDVKEPLNNEILTNLKSCLKKMINKSTIYDDELEKYYNDLSGDFKLSIDEFNKKINDLENELNTKILDNEKVSLKLVQDLNKEIEDSKAENEESLVEQTVDIQCFLSSSNQHIEVVKDENNHSNNRFEYQHEQANESYSNSIEQNNNKLADLLKSENKKYKKRIEQYDLETHNILKEYDKALKENEKKLKIVQEKNADLQKNYSAKKREESIELNTEIRNQVMKRNDEISIFRNEYNNLQKDSSKERDEKKNDYQQESQKVSRDFVYNVNNLEEEENKIKLDFDEKITFETKKKNYDLYKIHLNQEKELKNLYDSNYKGLSLYSKAKRINKRYYKEIIKKEKSYLATENNYTSDFEYEIRKNDYDKKLLDIDRTTYFNILSEKENKDNKYYQEMSNVYENKLNFDIYKANLDFNKIANDIRLENDIKAVKLEKDFDEETAKYEMEIESINTDIKKVNLEIELTKKLQEIIHDYEDLIHQRAINYYTVKNLLEIERFKVLKQYNDRQYDLNTENANEILKYSIRKIELQNKKFEATEKEKAKLNKAKLERLTNLTNFKIIENNLNKEREYNLLRRNFIYENDVFIYNTLVRRYNLELKYLNYVTSSFISITNKLIRFISIVVESTFESIIVDKYDIIFLDKYLNDLFKLLFNFYENLIHEYKDTVSKIIDNRLKFEEEFKFKKIYDAQKKEHENNVKRIKDEIKSEKESYNLYDNIIEDARKSIFNIRYEEERERKTNKDISYYVENKEKILGLHNDIKANQALMDARLKNIEKLESDLATLEINYQEDFNEIRENQHSTAIAYYNLKDDLFKIIKETINDVDERTEIYYSVSKNKFSKETVVNFASFMISIFQEFDDKIYKCISKFNLEASKNNSTILRKTNNQYEKDINKINQNHANKLFDEREKFLDKDRKFETLIEELEREMEEKIASYDKKIAQNEEEHKIEISQNMKKRKESITKFYNELYAVVDNAQDINLEYNEFVVDAKNKFEADKAVAISNTQNKSFLIDEELLKYITGKKELINYLPIGLKEQIRDYQEENKLKNKDLDDEYQVEKEKYVLRTKELNKVLSTVDANYNDSILKINVNNKKLKNKERKTYIADTNKIKKNKIST